MKKNTNQNLKLGMKEIIQKTTTKNSRFSNISFKFQTDVIKVKYNP